MLRLLTALAVGLAAASGLGCSSDAGPESGDPDAWPRPEPFIALDRDLDGFRAWPSVDVRGADLPGGHEPGDGRVYVNVVPEGEEGDLPVGTIVVKLREDGDPSTWEVHAMAKRGGGYNADGAAGWEWLDLEMVDADTPVIEWRGEGTPADPGGYGGAGLADGGMAMDGCNSCHGTVAARDFVFSRMLLPYAVAPGGG